MNEMHEERSAIYPIDPAARIGTVTLKVTNRANALGFYRDVIGLQLLDDDGDRLTLGAGGEPLVVLRVLPSARPRSQRTAGLYHLAILLPDRAGLARLLQHIIESGYPVGGASDHGVSEAVYISDPDGNGLEVYRDHTQSEWPRKNGELSMTLDPLDVDGLFGELAGETQTWQGLPTGTTIGHIHLQVSHLDEALVFYRSVLGFDLVQRYGPSAAFVSAGGYHHHVGMNTWAGVGVPPAPADALGLDHFTIVLPDAAALMHTVAHIHDRGTPVEEHENVFELADPSGNRIALVAKE